MSTEKHKITLFCEGTPNPLKISIALEELGLQYNVRFQVRSAILEGRGKGYKALTHLIL
jgi:glutathione S-transferase